MTKFKGALDNFSLIHQFFQKFWKSGYPCGDCMLNLTCNFNLVTKLFEYFLHSLTSPTPPPPHTHTQFKMNWQHVWLSMFIVFFFNLPPSAIILFYRKILNIACALNKYKKMDIMQIMTFWFRITTFWIVTWIQISLIPTLCVFNKKLWILHFQKEFFTFSSCICK